LLPCGLGSGEASCALADGSCRRMKKRWGLRNRCYRRPEEAMAMDGEAMPLMEGSRTPNRCCCRRRRPSAPKTRPTRPPLDCDSARETPKAKSVFRSSGRPCSGDPCDDSGRIYGPAFLQANPIQLDLLFTWPICNP
jgi:hypothetical protein